MSSRNSGPLGGTCGEAESRSLSLRHLVPRLKSDGSISDRRRSSPAEPGPSPESRVPSPESRVPSPGHSYVGMYVIGRPAGERGREDVRPGEAVHVAADRQAEEVEDRRRHVHHRRRAVAGRAGRRCRRRRGTRPGAGSWVPLGSGLPRVRSSRRLPTLIGSMPKPDTTSSRSPGRSAAIARPSICVRRRVVRRAARRRTAAARRPTRRRTRAGTAYRRK